MIYHNPENVNLLFRHDRDIIIGSTSLAVFATPLSCQKAVTKARYLRQVKKLFSPYCTIRAIFCLMGEMLLGRCGGYVIVVKWSKRCEIIEKKKSFIFLKLD